MTTGLRWFAGFSVAVLVAACSTAGSPSSAPAPAATVTATAAAAQPSASKPSTAVSPSAPASGTRHVVGNVLGEGALPGYTVEVPSGWSTTNASFVTKDGPGVVIGLSVWDVAKVPTDPCHWKKHLVDPGPTVDDLARALAAQSTRHATQPTDVTLAGQSGTYLEWSVPADMVVTGDSDFKGCDTWPDNGHNDFVSWLSSTGNDRYMQVAGQVDHLWILDVSGQRLVVDATYSPNASAADQAELTAMAASIRFEVP